MNRKLAIGAIVASGMAISVQAEQYKVVASGGLSYSDNDNKYTSEAIQYYFDPLTTLGPKDYFGFNQRYDSVGVTHSYADQGVVTSNSIGVFGEINWHGFQIKGQYASIERDSDYWRSSSSSDIDFEVQYFISEKWSVGGGTPQFFRGQESGIASPLFAAFEQVYTRYSHDVTDRSHLGVSLSASTGSSFYYVTLDSFTEFDGGYFLRAEVTITDELDYLAYVDFYLDRETSFGAMIIDSEIETLYVNKFITDELKLGLKADLNEYDKKLGVYLSGYF